MTYSSRSMIGSDSDWMLNTHAVSSIRWLPTVIISFAAPVNSSPSSIELRTRLEASITAPNELIQASLSWLERK